MQPTVSMVIACFNKQEYIRELLDSILVQSWNNIQVILVNDGSTDETGNVLAEYKPRLCQRGFETIIIEQENTGIALAVHNGLKKATGEFVCMPDADDVLQPAYVEHMAGWLVSHPEVQWTVCDSDRTRWTHRMEEYTDKPCDVSRFENLLERYLLMCNFGMVWQLMIRTAYLKKVHVLDCLALLGWSTTHEAPVWISIILGQGKGTYLPQILYLFRDTPVSLSNPGDVEKVLGYARRYKESIIKVLDFWGVTESIYTLLAILREFTEIFIHAPELVEYSCRKLSHILIQNHYINSPIDPVQFYIGGKNPSYGFLNWIWSNFIEQLSFSPKGEVVAYGALGAKATQLLPVWNETKWKPTRLWDKNGSGLFVTKPDVLSLSENDVILVFPTNRLAIEEIKDELKDCKAMVLYRIEMDLLLRNLNHYPFPAWKNASDHYMGKE